MVKAWKDGDYVDADALDEFTASGNLVFPTSAARDAFLVGDLAPKAGMFSTITSEGMTFKYIVVGGIGYWSPMPGTFLVHVGQATTHTLGAANAITPITNMSAIVGRNYKNWFDTSTSRFKPLCPGWYEIDGTVCFSANTVGERRLWLALNDGLIEGTATVYAVINTSEAPVIPLRTCYVWMNGTTDNLMIQVQHTSSSTLTTATQNYTAGLCTFTARYAGV